MSLRRALFATLHPTCGTGDPARTTALVDQVLVALSAHRVDVPVDPDAVTRAAQVLDPPAWDPTCPDADAQRAAVRTAARALTAAAGPRTELSVPTLTLLLARAGLTESVAHQAAAVVVRHLGAGTSQITSAQFQAAVTAMAATERLHPRAPLDALLHAALPALGVTWDPGADN